MLPRDGRLRVVVENVAPQLDGGAHPIRRVLGESVDVTATIFADSHDLIAAHVLFRPEGETNWRFAPMLPLGNDRWKGSFAVDKLGSWSYAVAGWIDHFATWASDLDKRLAAQRGTEKPSDDLESGADPLAADIALAFRTGAALVEDAASRASRGDAILLQKYATSLRSTAAGARRVYEKPFDDELLQIMKRNPDLTLVTRSSRELSVRVDRQRALFSSWYELFPRSASPVPNRHGTFNDVERQLPEIAAMGFDILYMPPIHPIGRAFRKGPNNSTVAPPDAVGSPWAIGDRTAVVCAPLGADAAGDCGGHKSIHPALGSFADFDRLVSSARRNSVELALDIAFQCSPDHPWVVDHPEWFIIRPDGSIQYAENPPKKYQDIYPLNFETSDWKALWHELYSVFDFWIDRGVRVFRVDNPHTKSFAFWAWCLEEIFSKHPEVIFLAEAFTRPHLMYGLAMRGFTQSYTYFTWRNSKHELQTYMNELTHDPVCEFFRPNLWPNTPDILHKSLQEGGRPAFIQRVILAATLAASYGIYGPAYELAENMPSLPPAGRTESEEYLNSEKYEIRQRDRNASGSLVPLITTLNRIRRENRALQSNASLNFHSVDNPNLICYSKATPAFDNAILVVVNLDSFHEQTGWASLDLNQIGLDANAGFVAEDLLDGAHYNWAAHNYVALHPGAKPAHIFRVVRGQ